MTVYVIRMEKTRFFKIGFTDMPNGNARLASLQTSSPFVLRVFLTVKDANRDLEAHLHSRFNESHVRGEWFNLDRAKQAELRRYLKEEVPLNEKFFGKTETRRFFESVNQLQDVFEEAAKQGLDQSAVYFLIRKNKGQLGEGANTADALRDLLKRRVEVDRNYYSELLDGADPDCDHDVKLAVLFRPLRSLRSGRLPKGRRR